MAVTATRTLPGFRFETVAPPPADVLPRMDVAAFVGFAASGPLHRPVAVESAAEFAGIFGPDAPLARDAARGEMQYCNLGAAVRAFFRNGGVRCWIVRVARKESAESNVFPIPGTLRVGPGGAMDPAFARARSEGSWSDDLRLSTALNADSISLTQISWQDLRFQADAASAAQIVPGDLIQLTFADSPLVAFLPVASVSNGWLQAAAALWFSTALPVPPGIGSAWIDTPAGAGQPIPVVAVEPAAGGSIAIDLALASVDAASPGAMLRVEFPGARLWLSVQSAAVTLEAGSPPGGMVRVLGQGLWSVSHPPVPPPGKASAYRLTFDLRVRGDSSVFGLDNLGFAPGHPYFWGDLPSDLDLYTDPTSPTPAPAPTALWTVAASPRFPLAGGLFTGCIFVPVGMSALPDQEASAIPAAAPPLVRDGLAAFDWSLFVDTKLARTGAADLLAEADFIRFQSSSPRALLGMHALLGVDEVSLLLLPDAVQAGWQPAAAETAPQAGATNPVAGPAKPPGFFRCSQRAVPAPALSVSDPDSHGTYTLSWTASAGETFELDEAESPDFSDAVPILTGPDTSLTLFGKAHGDYFYKVRAIQGANASPWSNGIGVRVAVSTGFRLNPVYNSATLLAVQQNALALCAARGDLLAVLDLPRSYREDDAIAYTAALKAAGSESTFSYGAVYHPWPLSRDDTDSTEFRAIPPCGAAAGILARRANARGAWIAPANEVMSGIVDLEPRLARERRPDLFEAQINVIGQEARGFLTLSADTLSDDDDLRPINVRRLLMLLRRIALQRGARYVFEPNSPAFQRLVARGFDAVLRDLFRRGAFAGSTPSTSYQVVTDSSINTPQSMDEGRIIVELKVAPALPLTFLTVRLVETGDQTLFVESR
jgi:hypothetical protein